MTSTTATQCLDIIYDGECPFCSRFVELYRIRKNVGVVRLTNVRERPDLIAAFNRTGIDIDNGMIVKWDGRDFYGASAVSLLSMLAAEDGLWSKVNALLFKNPQRARRVYPFLVFGRKVALKLMGRKLINEA
jgi:predicted DCC family thiol-disulfide oxidoreductase YuxK